MFLEQSKKRGLEMLQQGPLRFFVAEDREAVLIGVGYAVAKGWATYAGDGQFQITTEGVKALREL